MGSPRNEENRGNNETQHQVSLGAFFMGKYQVTQREYRSVMGTNPSRFKGDNLPVENVSWFDAVEYCNRRSRQEGLTEAYTISGSNDNRVVTWNREAGGYRLPTEAEWEYACRAGTGTSYSTGSSVAAAGWYSGNSGGRIHAAGGKQPNPWGLYDMHGNVWEWCWDWFDSYGSDPQTNPSGPETPGTYRVNRGGSWNDDAHYLRSAKRTGDYPSGRSGTIGFRVVRRPGG
jgi:formylglycine-generating enzyme required for sulfatase activity